VADEGGVAFKHRFSRSGTGKGTGKGTLGIMSTSTIPRSRN